MNLTELEGAGLAVRGDTLDALALNAGVDGAQLTPTVAAWTVYARGESDDPWRPDDTFAPMILTPPFHAIRLALTTSKGFGGIDVDVDGRVLDTAARPIPGVFAAGELTGMAGGSLVEDRAFNGSVSAVVYSGRVAGATAAAEALQAKTSR